MFGEEYFTARKRLSGLILRVLALAEKTGADPKPLLDNNITKGLSNPFLFVVCGEVNAGKSTLLNGLFGEEISKTNVLPETNHIQWYRYGEKAHVKEVSPMLIEHYLPVDFLIDFNLVDTPGTNSVVRGHQAITDRFLPVADLVFWVFPAANPWGASTWDFIATQNKQMIEKSIFVIQQADLHDEKDLEVIMTHMRELAGHRLGISPPIYRISGKLALKAKAQYPFATNLWHESGYPALEKEISSIVAQSSSRRKVLVKARDATGQVMRNIENILEQRTRKLEGKEEFLHEIETELEEGRKQQSSDYAVKLASTRDVYFNQSAEIKQFILQKMSVWASLKSLFTKQNIAKTIESALVDSVKSAFEAQADEDCKHLVDEYRKHWQTIPARVRDRLAISLGDFDQEAERLEISRDSFTKRMGRAARQAVVDLKIRGGLDMQLAERRAGLKIWLYVCLVLLLAAGLAGAFRISPEPYLALGLLALAIIAMATFAIRSATTRREVIQSFGERLDDARLPFADALDHNYRAGVRDFYLKNGTMLEGVRRHIADAKQELEPDHEQWHGLFLELKEIEQEI